MVNIGHQHRVNGYEEVFTIDNNRIISMIKVRVIQAMIQVERPSGWGSERVRKLALELKCIEIYDAAVKNKKDETKTKWEPVK